uniref:LRAT domain-containing protein n=1 Tax=Nelumbo nucifera TaxID=4432 RepID=A0A822YFT1_NELNU|nr:TPA_asm: hypothetical protein HUJ06_031557 [Nelumbo nucifera]
MEKIKELRSIRALIVNKIDRSELKEGDHIYCWRSHLYLYAHHGIYIGNEQVIHFTPARGGNSSHFAAASWDASSSVPGFSCPKCDNSSRDREGVCKLFLDFRAQNVTTPAVTVRESASVAWIAFCWAVSSAASSTTSPELSCSPGSVQEPAAMLNPALLL